MSHQNIPNCPDCQCRMDLGFLPELADNHITGLTGWHPGAAEVKRFLGMKTHQIRVDWKQVYPVTTFRCPRCGLLRSYAHLEADEG